MDKDQALIRTIICVSWLIVVILVLGGWFLADREFAWSVCIGGVLVNGSFLLLKKDIEQVLNRVSKADASQRSGSRVEVVRFLVKCNARLVILGLVLITLVTRYPVDGIGLSLGLATVGLSVIVVVLSKGKSIYSKLVSVRE
ncbi:MAG: hypothetical protein CSA33_06715 [Desulfobulbus propionicus]|nr:MAG: hypothetical protein CSA33_06715 [Desulfobulbus propionicus]